MPLSLALSVAFAVAVAAIDGRRSSRCGLASKPDTLAPFLVLGAGAAVGAATWMLLRGRNSWLRLGGAVAAGLATGAAELFYGLMSWVGHCAN